MPVEVIRELAEPALEVDPVDEIAELIGCLAPLLAGQFIGNTRRDLSKCRTTLGACAPGF
jgi:hypothetical protein